MSLTKIDCSFFRGKDASIETSSLVALNPCQKPGSLVIGGASAAHGNIGAQVACRLSLEHFVDGVFQYFGARDTSAANATSAMPETSVEILEAAFKNANTSVYNFGHKLAAGGRMAASLLGLVIEENTIAAGRVGHGTAYLFRGGEMFPFFDTAGEVKGESTLGGFVGSNSLVSVELASVPSAESDLILVFSEDLDAQAEKLAVSLISEIGFEPDCSCAAVIERLKPVIADMSFFIAARIGPEAIYLQRSVAV